MVSMAAVRIIEWGRPPELVEVARPEPGPGQVRIRVAGCGLCHSDLTMAAVPAEVGEAMGWRVPFTLGHETAGWVDAWGTGVSGWQVGDPVALVSPASCGRCRACGAGRENGCPAGLVGRGYGRDGGLAEYVLVDDPARALLTLGDLDPRTAGPLTDAGATSHHAVARVAPRVGADGAVVVLGVGGLGAFVVQLARALTPGRVVAVDPLASRRTLAAGWGAHATVDGVDEHTAERLAEQLGPVPVDAVIDLVGTDATIGLGARLVTPGGAWAVVGAGGGTLRRPWFGGLPRDADVFSFQGSDRADLQAVIDLAQRGAVTVDVDPYPLARALDAYAAFDDPDRRGRAVVQPDPPTTAPPTPEDP